MTAWRATACALWPEFANRATERDRVPVARFSTSARRAIIWWNQVVRLEPLELRSKS
jgi:hypothetical protein